MTDYFVNTTDAAKIANISATNVDYVEAKLREMGIEPVGRILGHVDAGKTKVFRPFYDPSEIEKRVDEEKSIQDQIDLLQEQLKLLRSGSARIPLRKRTDVAEGVGAGESRETSEVVTISASR